MPQRRISTLYLMTSRIPAPRTTPCTWKQKLRSWRKPMSQLTQMSSIPSTQVSRRRRRNRRNRQFQRSHEKLIPRTQLLLKAPRSRGSPRFPRPLKLLRHLERHRLALRVTLSSSLELVEPVETRALVEAASPVHREWNMGEAVLFSE